MPGTYRNRFLDQESPVSGTISFFGVNPFTDTMQVGTYTNCEDYVGNREGANPFSLREMIRFFPCLQGVNGAWEFQNYPIGYHSTNVADPDTVFPPLDSVEQEEMAWDVLSKTNPSSTRNGVNVPAFIGELKDLPSLIRQTGQGILRTLASANLSWRFGFAPMLSDIRKMCKFIDTSEQKFNELRKLRDNKALRKRVDLGYEQVVGTPFSAILHSQGAYITGTRTNIFTRKAWATAEWKLHPDTDIPKTTDAELLKLARRLTTGITTFGAAKTAWELLPWSWMADWCGNVQQFIEAHDNTVPCTWGRICYMATTKGTAHIEVDPTSVPAGVSLVGGQFRIWVTRKRRIPLVPISPIPLPKLPILDNGKWSILASLAALRLLKP